MRVIIIRTLRTTRAAAGILTSALLSEGGMGLLIGFPVTLYFFASSALKPF